MHKRVNKASNFKEFNIHLSQIILNAKKSFEQVLQYDSKYFRADPLLYKYDISLLSQKHAPHIEIKKLYIIVKNKEVTRKSAYTNYILPYTKNGFDVKPIFLSEINSDNTIYFDDIILVDNELCITAKTEEQEQNLSFNEEITSYFFSDVLSDESRIKKVRRLLRTLRKLSFEQSKIFRVVEPLIESADMNYKLAHQYCSNGIMSHDNDCTWYHSVWQYLRIINKVSSPEWHADFYKSCFTKLFSLIDQPKILISGSADYSLLAYIHECAKNCNKNTIIHIVDTCSTPLKMCEWYAERCGFEIQKLHMDIRDLSHLGNKYDLICTDAFLTRFSPKDAKDVISSWFNSLNDQGMIVTTVRIRDNSDTKIDPTVRIEYINDCIKRFTKWEGYFNISLDEFRKMVDEYSLLMTSHDLGNRTQIASLFTDQGFIFDDLTNSTDTPGELFETAYFEICCNKGK